MREGRGYLTRVQNPTMSGLAIVVFRSSRRITRTTQYTTTYVDAGFGVRQLVAAVGDGRGFTKESGEIPLWYEIDDLGLLVSVEPFLLEV